MKLLIFILGVTFSNNVHGQTVRRAQLLQHRAYMIDVLSDTLQQVEDLHWCNLKIPQISQRVNIEFFGETVIGEVTYKNGFVVSVQHVDIIQSSVQQVWAFSNVNRVGSVDSRAHLRMHNVVIGFDVVASLNGRIYRYTSTYTHALLVFQFSIFKNMQPKEITVTVTGVNPSVTGRMSYYPQDKHSDLLGTVFTPSLLIPGTVAWGPEIFQPRAYDVVMNKVEFPSACFNC